MKWDIFCCVIDNYGDIGVCWRLSRQLVAEYGIAVRLWLDDVASLQRICPDTDANLEIQYCRGVEVRCWREPFPEVLPAEVVIEAFGCNLPQNYIAAMIPALPQSSDRAQGNFPLIKEEGMKRVWINLEYLSAEQWVEGCHGLASPHPRLPLTKYFFFPGFTSATGGLLQEKRLLAQRDAFQRQPVELWRQLGLTCPIPNETIVSLFCYDNVPVSSLLDAWVSSSMPLRCLVPEGKALPQIASWAGLPGLVPGDSVRRGSLTLHVIPFMSQEDYDRLLWACDCNFVRGEDSFVRAQWAARPLIWQIYPQQDNVHQVKLAAFLNSYCQGLAENAADALRIFHQNWNNGGHLDWDNLWRYRAVLQAHAMSWARHIDQTGDLVSNLLHFCKNQGV